MNSCTCPTPPPTTPCAVHFGPISEESWIPLGETQLIYHPSHVLRAQFRGKLCARCGRELPSGAARLCSECLIVQIREGAKADAWTQSAAKGEILRGKTF